MPWRPTAAELAEARALRLRDVIGPGLRVLFCGINPGLYSGAVGHHFARPGNRFWPALHRSGFTQSQLSPFDDGLLLALGLGITNVCPRTTARADELSADELRAGGRALARKVRRHRPAFLAVVGIGAYRVAFDRPLAVLGPQPEGIGETRVWVLPNTSGLNAHHPLPALVRSFAALRAAVPASRVR